MSHTWNTSGISWNVTHISMIYIVRCSPYTLTKLIWHESSILRAYNILHESIDYKSHTP